MRRQSLPCRLLSFGSKQHRVTFDLRERERGGRQMYYWRRGFLVWHLGAKAYAPLFFVLSMHSLLSSSLRPRDISQK
ncbi:MAG: hypothetical protein FWG75_01200 [Cystobacterineae bacterium]|nr:hypothetical protein [Cystobacterineae bacterium]